MAEDRQVEVRELPCKLTEKERMDKAKLLAQSVTEKSEAEDQRKAMASDYKAKIDGMEAQIQRLSGHVTTGMESRRVDCVWEFDLDRKTKFLIRTDTGETVSQARLTQDELQAKL